MAEREVREVVVDEHVLTFDGRVLDVFNGRHGAIRVHILRMQIETSEARKGHLLVKFTATRGNTPIETIDVAPENRPAMEALIAELNEAIADAKASQP